MFPSCMYLARFQASYKETGERRCRHLFHLSSRNARMTTDASASEYSVGV